MAAAAAGSPQLVGKLSGWQDSRLRARRPRVTQSAQEGLWFHGGNLALSRYYSLYLALQLKARMEGIPTPVYKRAEVHHTE